MKTFFSKLLAGFVIGAGAIIPGLSGGILAVSMGLYKPMLDAIAGLVKNFKKNFIFLFPLGLGGLIGLALFMFLLDWLFADFRTAVISLFLGLVAGSIPSFLREANNGAAFKKTNLIFTAVGFVAAMALSILGFEPASGVETAKTVTHLQAALCGGVVILGTVIPGISTSFILINMGLYDAFLGIFTGIFNDFGHKMPLVLSSVAGMAVVALPLLMVIRKLLDRYHCKSFYTIFGILLATMFTCAAQEISLIGSSGLDLEIWKVTIYIALFAGGLVASYYMEKGMNALGLREPHEAQNGC